MEQVQIGAGAPLAGRTIIEANLRQRFGVVVVGIQRANGAHGIQPAARDASCRSGTISSCSARQKNLRELEAAARTARRLAR